MRILLTCSSCDKDLGWLDAPTTAEEYVNEELIDDFYCSLECAEKNKDEKD